MIERDEAQLRARKEVVQSLVSDLQEFYRGEAVRGPRIEFVEGKTKIERFLYANDSMWADSILQGDGCSWGYQDHSFVESFNNWIRKTFKEWHVERGIKGRLLSNRSQKA